MNEREKLNIRLNALELKDSEHREDSANPALTEEELTEYETILESVKRLNRLAAVRATSRELDQPVEGTPPVKPDPSDTGKEERRIEVGNDREAQKPFETFGEQLQAVYRAATEPHNVDKRLLEMRAASGASEGVPSAGGFLVQTDFSSELLRKTYESGAIVSRARRIPMSSNADSFKINAIDETSRANGSRYGGVQAYWLNEAGAITASKPKYRQIELRVNKVGALGYATEELLADAAATGAVMGEAFRDELAFKVEDSFIRGTGSGQPLGILNASCLLSVAKETGQSASTIVTENIWKMWARMFSRSRSNAVWFINQDIEPQLYGLALEVGTAGVPVYLPSGGISERPFGSLMGRPVIPVEYCSTLGTQGDIILADFSQYLYVDKSARSAQSMHVKFTTEEMAFRVTYRIDGQPHWTSALTPANGSNTQSPFVVLDTRA